MKSKLKVVLFMVFSLVVFNQAKAQIADGSFESGSSSAWSSIGSFSVGGTMYGVTPQEGSNQAFLSTQNGALISTLADFTITPIGAFPYAYNGSALKQIFSARANDTISFDWNFVTSETIGETIFKDFSFVNISPNTTTPATPGSSSFFMLADTTSSFLHAANNAFYPGQTGYHNFSYQIPTAGEYTLSFGVANIGDKLADSGLMIDKVQTMPVAPEPLSCTLFLLGAGALAGKRLRKTPGKK